MAETQPWVPPVLLCPGFEEAQPVDGRNKSLNRLLTPSSV